MKHLYTNPLEDHRAFNRHLARLHEHYPPQTVQHEADLNSLARCNWLHDRLANLVETDIRRHLDSPILAKIADSNLRLLHATRRAVSHSSHRMLIRQNEANLRATNTVAARVLKWNSTR